MGVGDEYDLETVPEETVIEHEAETFRYRDVAGTVEERVERYAEETHTYVDSGDPDTDFLEAVEYGMGVSDWAGEDTWHIDAVDAFRRTVNEVYEDDGIGPFLESRRLKGILRLMDDMADYPYPQNREERKRYLAATRVEFVDFGPKKEDVMDRCRDNVKNAVTGD